MYANESTSATMVAENSDSDLPPQAWTMAKLKTRPLEILSTLVEHISFSGDEQRKIALALKKLTSSAQRIRYAYDITVAYGSEQPPPASTIRLSSKTFGYDFALVKTQTKLNLFGKPKYVVRIYRSRFGEDNYAYLQMTTSPAKALTLIDQMYCHAAELHLP